LCCVVLLPRSELSKKLEGSCITCTCGMSRSTGGNSRRRIVGGMKLDAGLVVVPGVVTALKSLYTLGSGKYVDHRC